MIKNTFFALSLLAGFTFLGVGCSSAPQVQAPSPKEEEKLFNKCVAKIKKEMLAPPAHVSASESLDLDSLKDKLYSEISTLKPVEQSFERAIKDGVASTLAVELSFKNDADEYALSTKLDDQSFDSKDVLESNRLLVSRELKVERNGLVFKTVAEKFEYDYSAGCNATRKEIEYTTYALQQSTPAQVGKSIEVHTQGWHFQNSVATDKKEIITLRLEPCGQRGLPLQSENATYPRVEKCSYFPLGGIELESSFEKAPTTIQDFDPIVNENADFEVIEHATRFAGQTWRVREVKSKASTYNFYTIDIMPGTRFETIDQELWNKTEFAEDRNRVSVGLNYELAAIRDGRKYQLETKSALVFDNYDAYFRVVNVDRNTESDPHVSIVEFDTTAARKPFEGFGERPWPATLDPKFASYTAADEHYDFEHPEIARIVERLKARIEKDNLTQGETINLLLSEVNSLLTFDRAMIYQNSVTRIKASEVLKRESGVCQHFAGLFVGLARGLGIASREVVGFHQTARESGQPSNGLHAWVEVLVDGDKWLPLEPQSVLRESDSKPRVSVEPLEIGYFPLNSLESSTTQELLSAALLIRDFKLSAMDDED